MNEATPPWRAFSSDAPASADPEAHASSGRSRLHWLLPLLAGLGGIAAGAAVAGLAFVALGALTASEDGTPLSAPAAGAAGFGLSEPKAVATAAPTDLVVDVAGAVVRPGLHRMRPGDRVGDAIEAAGGFAPRADLAASSHALNLAKVLEDGAKVLVPELGIDRPAAAAAAPDDGRVDLNRASQSELESLPGVGPVTATKIMAAREDEPFDGIRELRSRGLVGESVYQDIKGLVRAS